MSANPMTNTVYAQSNSLAQDDNGNGEQFNGLTQS